MADIVQRGSGKRRRLGGLLLAGLAAAACVNEGSDLGFGPDDTRVVGVVVYLDRDGSRTLTALDTLFRNARVALLPKGSADTFKTALTDLLGTAIFSGVPLGQYRVAVVPATIGDSLEIQEYAQSAANFSPDVQVTFSIDTAVVVTRLGFPEVSIRQARNLPQGRRVFIRGVVLSGVQSFRDTTSHLADSSGALRLTEVTLRGGLTGNNPGDSVSVLGLTSARAGQPTLGQATIARFATRPAPIPLPIATGTAATANNGVLDAQLVQITGAVITDSSTIAPDFRVVVSDGTGSLTIILDANIAFNRILFCPGRSLNANGVLVPDGVGGWLFKPRGTGDVNINLTACAP